MSSGEPVANLSSAMKQTLEAPLGMNSGFVVDLTDAGGDDSAATSIADEKLCCVMD